MISKPLNRDDGPEGHKASKLPRVQSGINSQLAEFVLRFHLCHGVPPFKTKKTQNGTSLLTYSCFLLNIRNELRHVELAQSDCICCTFNSSEHKSAFTLDGETSTRSSRWTHIVAEERRVKGRVVYCSR